MSGTDPTQRLADPARRRAAARAVVQAGDPDALLDLVAAYDRPPAEGREHLLDAMERLGGIDVAGRWATSDDRVRRHCAARLMHLLPDEAHVPHLVDLVTDPDAVVAQAARRALAGQRRTPEWQAAVKRIAAASQDETLRAAAASWLAIR